MVTSTQNTGIASGEKINISVVIPCYNSDESLVQLVAGLQKLFNDIVRESYEIILVDDGSPSPGTWPTLVGLSNKYPEVLALQLTRNFGKPGALMCGYSQARGNWIVAMDDDLQHLPEDIPLFLEQRQHGLVMGRFKSRKHPRWQQVTSNMKGWLDYKMLGKPRHVYLSPFHMIRRDVVDAMLDIKTPTPHIGALMMHVTRDVAMVNVNHQPREYGKSNFTFARRVKQFSNLLINNSSLLLNLVATLGILISLLSMIYGMYIAFRRLFLGAEIIEGWTSLMVVTLVIGGILMFSLGVVGEYLLRIINGLENRPAFVVGKQAGTGRQLGGNNKFINGNSDNV